MNPEEKKLKKNLEEVMSGNTEKKEEEKPETVVVEHEPIKSLRTYQGDVQEAMTRDRSSVTSIFLAEQRKKGKTLIDGERKPLISTEEKNKFIAITAGLLLTLGIIAVSVGYYLSSKEKVLVEQQTKAIIAFSEEKILDLKGLDRNNLAKIVLEEKEKFSLPINSVLYINIEQSTGTPATVSDFLEIFGQKIPPSLVRTFSTKYMLGIYSFDTNEPFIILKTEDYPGSFEGMLRWEKDIVMDLGKIFSIEKNASSTESTVFTDKAYKNKDLRILKNSKGKTDLLYSFIDKNTLLITKNENIFSAILSKFFIAQ